MLEKPKLKLKKFYLNYLLNYILKYFIRGGNVNEKV